MLYTCTYLAQYVVLHKRAFTDPDSRPTKSRFLVCGQPTAEQSMAVWGRSISRRLTSTTASRLAVTVRPAACWKAKIRLDVAWQRSHAKVREQSWYMRARLWRKSVLHRNRTRRKKFSRAKGKRNVRIDANGTKQRKGQEDWAVLVYISWTCG